MNNKLLISKVLTKYSNTDAIYPLRKYSANLKDGKKDNCRRVTDIISCALFDSDDLPSLYQLSQEMKKIKDIEDHEIFLFIYAFTRQVFINLYKERISINSAVSLLSETEDFDMESFYSSLSEVNRILLRRNPHHYKESDDTTRDKIRKRIYSYAKKHGISEIEAAKIYTPKNKSTTPIMGKLFFPLLFSLTAFSLLLLFFFLGFVPALLLALPVYEAYRIIILYFTSKWTNTGFIPRLRGDRIPSNAKTAIVITSLMDSDNISKLLENIEDIYNRNRDNNAIYGILGDLPESDSANDSKDNDIINAAVNGISSLNQRYGEHFCLFIRPRKYTEDSDKFSGWERKRGAIIDICAFLEYGEKDRFSHTLIPPTFIKSSRYLITLDFDTMLSHKDALRMVMAMLHPDNKPLVENGRVVSGYGIMQPRIVLSPTSASSTPFTLTVFGVGGADNYRVPCFDFYQSLFGRGLFCGKGIIDIGVFNRVLSHAFQNNRILSHDILEGAYARCGYLSDTVLTDSCPKNPISYYKRLHRWIRGDIQASLYLGKKVKRENMEVIKNPLDGISRHMILDNIQRALLFPAIFFCLAYGLVRSSDSMIIIALLAVLPLILPFLITSISCFSPHPRRFYSNTVESLCRSFCFSLYSLSSLPTEAFISIDAITRSLWRMNVSQKKLLQWTTSEGTEKIKSGFFSYLLKFLPSLSSGIVLVIFTSHPFLDFFGVLWILFPIIAYGLSSVYPSRPRPTESQKKRLVEYCHDTWGFYRDFVNSKTSFLPPDNFQERPEPVVAMRTSPTNIGLYLLCVALAHKFNFISKNEVRERISNTLQTVSELPKYRGHLYNWYDIKNLRVIGTPYISTVDSGNFIACLITLRSALSESGEMDDLVKICTDIIDNTHFGFLYNRKKKMLSIGYNTSEEKLTENCYDLLMSEARTTVYIALAKGDIPQDAWYRMGRPTVMKNGRPGIMSWSGTAFEYFMPALFLPVYNGSIFYEALGFALYEQINSCVHSLWGRSESAYFAFDYDMNYQYRAFGVANLSYDRENLKNDVISPYSSFLALCVCSTPPLENLSRLKKIGMYGKYGFYESIDFTASRVGDGHAIIYSYMAHHVGMSIAACANAVFGDVLQQWFMACPTTRGAMTLLFESIPSGVYVDKYKPTYDNSYKKPIIHSFEPTNYGTPPPNYLPDSASYCAGRLRFTALSDGKLCLYYKNKALMYPFFTKGSELRGFGIRIGIGDKVINPLDSADFSAFLTGASYKANKNGVSCQTDLSLSEKYSALCISLTLAGNFKSLTSLIYFEPVLDTVPSFSAHPAFSGLSVSSCFDSASKLLMFCRKEREGNHRETWLGVYPNFGSDYQFITRRDEAFSSCYDKKDIDRLLSVPFPCDDGACITPFCGIKKSSQTPFGRYSIDLILFCAESKDSLLSTVASFKRDKKMKKYGVSSVFSNELEASARRNFLISSADMSVIRLCSALRTRFLTAGKTIRKNMTAGYRDVLFSNGISGDLPVVTLVCNTAPDMAGTEIIRAFASACRYMKLQGEEFDLLILCVGEDESDPYRSPIRHEVMSIVTDTVGYSPLYRRGGIYISSKGTAESLYPFSSYLANVEKNCILLSIIEDLRHDSLTMSDDAVTKKLFMPTKQMTGEFTNDGFMIHKGKSNRPWCYIYSTRLFGTLLSQNSLGFSWYRNSREMRLTPWNNDPLLECRGEIICLELYSERFDLAAISDTVHFGSGSAIYYGSVSGISFEMQVGISNNLPMKYIKLTLKNDSAALIDGKISYHVTPELGNGASKSYKTTELGSYTVFTNGDLSSAGNISMFASLDDRKFSLSSDEKKSFIFILGAFNRLKDRIFYHMTELIKLPNAISEMESSYKELFAPITAAFRLDCPDNSICHMFNYYLPYGATAVRQFGRTGFFQSGGAYGFRDQLQDAMCLCDASPKLLKMQLLRCACNQYISGDVLHWWHESTFGEHKVLGVRTRCSDDYLWLVFATAKYVLTTGDIDLLDIKLPYLDSPPLPPSVLERCEFPQRTDKKESLFYHCIRALDRALGNISPDNGIPYIGSCDWNDGFSLVGAKGKGTSVWLGRFLQITLMEFSKVCRLIHETDFSTRFSESAKELSDSIEKNCFNGDYYLRGYYDDGSPLGDKSCKECRIDILPQAFSVFAEGKNQRTEKAMSTAFRELFRPDDDILCLFTPPFEGNAKNPGYIASYVQGTRENGGQYTHGALWGASAMFRLGKPKEGYRILRACNPASKYENEPIASRYGGEPYAVAGDIYSNPDFPGRAGWTQYTGAAGWLYNIILSDLLGYRSELCGKAFSMSPALFEDFPYFELDVNKNSTKYHISASLGEKDQWVLDGKENKNLFKFDKKEHYLKITVAKK